MISQQRFKNHYMNLYKSGAIYVWGANTETITKELTDKLYRYYGSSRYNKAYYDNKANKYRGRIGADCSGSIFPLSKKDNTAKGYYNACTKKGSIHDIPADTACLVFNASLSHVGAYMGDGTTIEMMGDADNCVRQTLKKSRWAYYGIPDWLEVPTDKYHVGQHVTYSSSYKQSHLSCGPANAKGGSGHGRITEIVQGQAKYKLDTGVYCNDGDIRRLYEPENAESVNNIEVVKNIQKWCNNYYGAGLVADGIFGPKTKKCLCMALQHCLNKKYKANLVVDGVFGAKTKSCCRKASAQKDLAFICQAMLFYKGYDMTHSIRKNNLNASYNPRTRNTVTEYQKTIRGLQPDGVCGPATFYHLFA